MLPDRRQVPLVQISDWDMHWEEEYRFRKPLALPRGTIIQMAAVFDNSADNPQNPSDPPRRVRWGNGPTDEMLRCRLQVVVGTREDLQHLDRLRTKLFGASLGTREAP